jgi:hypothetical protein
VYQESSSTRRPGSGPDEREHQQPKDHRHHHQARQSVAEALAVPKANGVVPQMQVLLLSQGSG